MNSKVGRKEPRKRTGELALALPASFVSDTPHLREKTLRIGLIGRAAAIFRADKIILFPDLPSVRQKSDLRLIALVLSYMETPQYLRKRLFKIEPGLRYAGVLPPLRTPHHPLENRTEDLKIDEYREGAVLSHSKKGSIVDIGVGQPALVQNTRLRPNNRITVRITKTGKHPVACLAGHRDIEAYWGYHVIASKVPFGRLVKTKGFDLVVATSRKGEDVVAVRNELTSRWRKSQRTLVAFGAPTQGLYEILAHEGLKLEDVADFIINTIPNQGTETVRTEEALYCTLSILNLLDES